jgi:hypothetical protein
MTTTTGEQARTEGSTGRSLTGSRARRYRFTMRGVAVAWRIARWATAMSMAVAVLGGASGTLQADDAMKPEAQADFDKGFDYYNIADYDKAISLFKAGYLIDQQPRFLYAIAQSERLEGDCKDALVQYSRYLDVSSATTDPTELSHRQNAQQQETSCETTAPPAPAQAQTASVKPTPTHAASETRPPKPPARTVGKPPAPPEKPAPPVKPTNPAAQPTTPPAPSPAPPAAVTTGAIPQPPTEHRWYGWQTIIVDGLAIPLAFLSPWAALPVYGLGGPIVHILHGHAGRGAGDFGLRLAGPVVGATVGGLVGGWSNGAPFFGAGGGALVAAAIDWIFLSSDEVPAAPADVSFAPVPLVRVSAGSFSLSFAGTF